MVAEGLGRVSDILSQQAEKQLTERDALHPRAFAFELRHMSGPSVARVSRLTYLGEHLHLERVLVRECRRLGILGQNFVASVRLPSWVWCRFLPSPKRSD